MGSDAWAELSGNDNFFFYGNTIQRKETRSHYQCAGLHGCHRAAGNGGNTVFMSNILVPPARAKRSAIVLMNLKKILTTEKYGVLL